MAEKFENTSMFGGLMDAGCTEEEIENMSAYERLDKYLLWHGIMGFTDTIYDGMKATWEIE